VTRPDGTSVTLTSLDGLPETRVHAVAQQGDALWVGTESGAARVTLEATPRVTRTVGRAPVHAILPDGEAVWVGTWGAGVFKMAAPDASAERVPMGATGTRVAALALHESKLYAAFADGPLAALDGGTLREVAGTASNGQALASLASAEGPRLMYGSLHGLYRIGGAQPPTLVSTADARGLAASGPTLLVASYGSGLIAGSTRGAFRGDAVIPRFTTGVGVRGAARCVATTEGVWTDSGDGAFKKLALGGPPGNDVTALAANGERVAVGTFDHGAAIWDGARFTRVPHVAATEMVSAVAWQGEGATARLWVGTAHGLYRVDPNGNARRFSSHDGLPHSLIRSVLVLPDGRVLAGTEEGAAFVSGERVTPLATIVKGRPQALSSPMHATWALARRADGVLFLGTAAGLYWGKDGKFERASLATGELQDDWVTALALAGDDVFVGTYSKGVTRLRLSAPKKRERPEAAHLGGGYVNPDGLAVLGGKLHAATMDGLLVRGLGDDASWALTRGSATGKDVTSVRLVTSPTGASLWVASRRGIAITPP
jgi:ligand-binding sensor domain-containing protein